MNADINVTVKLSLETSPMVACFKALLVTPVGNYKFGFNGIRKGGGSPAIQRYLGNGSSKKHIMDWSQKVKDRFQAARN